MLYVGCWMLDAGCWMLDAGCWMLDFWHMSSVVHLRKQLSHPPVALSVAGVAVRPIVVPEDIDAWLALRERATAGLLPPVRRWSREDFTAEMVQKPCWRSDWTWMASRCASVNDESSRETLIGTVTLALRRGREASVPVIHWLLVDPAWRRRGIGRLLVSQLEVATWNTGGREVQLETHSGWTEAVAFYQSVGYAARTAADDRLPR
jgi:GNAT superfamily N-acetyltransferase